MVEIIQAKCPECSTDKPVPHKILKETNELLIQCTLCNAVHSHIILKKTNKNIRVVVSTGEQSSTGRLIVESDEIVSIDDEFIVEDESGRQANLVQITSIESDGRRVDNARADEILTLWARLIDPVVVKISITRGWKTETVDIEVPGEQQFTVGEIISSGPNRFRIKKIKIRNGRFIQNEGETVMAKNIKRVFTDSMERIEWLNRPKVPLQKKAHRPQSRGSVIKGRSTDTWTSKKKENK
jgi:uncharacterized Zn finger protein